MATGRTALHLTMMCRGRDTHRITLCVASHLIASCVSPCDMKREQIRQLLPHCASLRTSLIHVFPVRESKQLRKLVTPCAFFSRHHVGHPKAEYAMGVALDRMWATTMASQAEYAKTPCASVRTSFILTSHCTLPKFAREGGERWRARLGCGGARGRQQAALARALLSAPRAFTTAAKKMSHTHTTLPPSYTMHSQMRYCFLLLADRGNWNTCFWSPYAQYSV